MAKKRGKKQVRKKVRKAKKPEKKDSIPKISRKKAIVIQKRHVRRQRRSFLNKLKPWELAELLGIMFGVIIGAILTTISVLPYPTNAWIIFKVIGFIIMLPLVVPYSIIIMIPFCAGGCLILYFIMGILIYAFIGVLCGPLIMGSIERHREKYKIKK